MTLKIDCNGPDGNVFMIIANIKKLCSPDQYKEIKSKITQMHSYNDVLDYLEKEIGPSIKFINKPARME